MKEYEIRNGIWTKSLNSFIYLHIMHNMLMRTEIRFILKDKIYNKAVSYCYDTILLQGLSYYFLLKN